MNWNADHYLKYGDERTRAAADLANRIQLASPRSIVDVGCGPGNSTQVLRGRWPDAEVVGIDSSPDMIAAAEASFPEQEWRLVDAAEWTPRTQYDLVYSNAALQWIPDHEPFIPKLFSAVAPGGALAFQIPSSTYATVRKLIFEISAEPGWNERMHDARGALTMHPPAFYYDLLCADAARLDLWESEYAHIMESKSAIVDWIASTGLRPFLAALADDTERESFVSKLTERVSQEYETRADGKVLYPFRRTFVIAYR